MQNENTFNQRTATNTLKDYVSRNRRALMTVGVSVSLYILGRSNGRHYGYCKGYGQCLKDMIIAGGKTK